MSTDSNEFDPAAEAASPSADATPPATLPPPPAPDAHLPEDIRVPWGLLDLFIFFGLGFGLLIVLTNVLASVVASLGRMNPAQLQEFVMGNAGFIAIRQALWFTLLILYLAVHVRARAAAGENFWRLLGWRGLRVGTLGRPAAVMACLLGGITLAIAVQVASVAAGRPEQLPIEQFFQSASNVMWMMAVGVLIAPLAEEMIFRGYFYPALARRLGVPGGVMATGLLFGLLHAQQLWGGWAQIALLVIVGVVFTYVRARTGSVVAPFLLHLGYNSILFLAFFFATGGLRNLPGAQ